MAETSCRLCAATKNEKADRINYVIKNYSKRSFHLLVIIQMDGFTRYKHVKMDGRYIRLV